MSENELKICKLSHQTRIKKAIEKIWINYNKQHRKVINEKLNQSKNNLHKV